MSEFNRNAPELIINGEKWEVNNESRIAVADRLIKAIGSNKKLKANERLLLLVLLGQARHGFHVSEKWVLDRTGMSHDSYLRCRKHLEELQYLSYENYKNITLYIEKIENDGTQENEQV